jgi:glucoamylase
MSQPSSLSLRRAPGEPGIPPRWASGSKDAVGTSRSDTSLVWFTVSRGILTEIFFPRIDSPCTRDARFIVTGPDGFYSDEQNDADHVVEWLEHGVPAFRIATTCKRGRYRIDKTIVTDDRLNAVVLRIQFSFTDPAGQRAYFYINPHLAGEGASNTAWLEEFKGKATLLAQRGDIALAVASSVPFVATSAGFVGKSDGIDELKQDDRLTNLYQIAERGNVALIGEIDLQRGQEIRFAIGIGLGAGEAAHHAWGALQHNFENTVQVYVERWQEWQNSLHKLDSNERVGRDLYRSSVATLQSHANKATPGAVASLAVPWGEHRGDEDRLEGAYHMVWPRDLVNHGSGLLAAGAFSQVRQLLDYLATTQEEDGHWPQNMWVSGVPFWDGIQMDQSAQPILLLDLAMREECLGQGDGDKYWPTVRRAAEFIVKVGPATPLDRWEEEAGYNAYTLSTMIAALRVAVRWAQRNGDSANAKTFEQTAFDWNSRIEGWLYVRETSLAKRLGIDGYYARILPPDQLEPPSPKKSHATLKDNREGKDGTPVAEVVCVDALALVRYGLRSPDDARVRNTVRAIDALLKWETDRGPIWRRYNGDRFGEHENGEPFRKHDKGVGRAWPLLIGERAHYELACGNVAHATQLEQQMANYASPTEMFPEQVWDAPDIPQKDLFRGQPTGSAMPLLWAHGEYVKLRRSLRDGRVFDKPSA